MAEVWSPDISQEISRQHDLTTQIMASGATSISPVYNVGPGADAAIARTQTFAIHASVAAGAAVTGAAGLVIPSTDPRIAVVRSINVDGPALGNQLMVTIQIPLGTLIETAFGPTLSAMPTNLRNFSTALGPLLGFTSGVVSPAISGIIDSIKLPGATQSVAWHRRFAVIVPNTALLVIMNANNLTYNVDIEFDLYGPQSK